MDFLFEFLFELFFTLIFEGIEFALSLIYKAVCKITNYKKRTFITIIISVLFLGVIGIIIYLGISCLEKNILIGILILFIDIIILIAIIRSLIRYLKKGNKKWT